MRSALRRASVRIRGDAYPLGLGGIALTQFDS
jgi:hypothetical protein